MTDTIYDERAERILDAAAALLLRYGYKRLTINDIATESEVATGTIYLHWKTKETLFESVLLRELLTLWRDLLQMIAADPAEVLLHRFLSHMLQRIKERPVARALFTQDVTLLGKLTHNDIVKQGQQMGRATEFFTLLRELKLMRTDTDLATQAYAFSAIWAGFVFVDQFLPSDAATAIDTQTAALAQTVQRVFEPDSPPSAAELRDHIAPTVTAFLEQICTYFAGQSQNRLIG